MITNLKNKIQVDDLTLVHDDCLNVLKSLPDNCIDLILTDPPYFKVKKNGWDNQWKTADDFLAWLDSIFAEFWRVLKPNGSLYVFCSPQLSAETEILVKKRFDVLNNITWAKPFGTWNGTQKEILRGYASQSERVIFAEHHNNEGETVDRQDCALKLGDRSHNVFMPIIDYFRNARISLNVSSSVINKTTKTWMCNHWFSGCQFRMPNREHYKTLQDLFIRIAKEKNITDCQLLDKPYDELVAQYESLRRPFNVTKQVPHTDVWTYKPVAYYPGKHPCEKPADMLEDIIRASSRECDLVADFFMGSGSTLKAARKLNRKCLGVEFEEKTFLDTVQDIEQSQLELENFTGTFG